MSFKQMLYWKRGKTNMGCRINAMLRVAGKPEVNHDEVMTVHPHTTLRAFEQLLLTKIIKRLTLEKNVTNTPAPTPT